MVYLIGCYHRHQWFGIKESKHPVELMGYIEIFLEDHEIDLIAEEFNEDCLDFSVKKIVCVEVANKYEIDHKYIEPTYDERTENDILGEDALLEEQKENDWSDEELQKHIDEDFAKRERFWLNTIEEDYDTESDILVVCGNAHIDSFSDLLIQEGYEVDNIQNFDLS